MLQKLIGNFGYMLRRRHLPIHHFKHVSLQLEPTQLCLSSFVSAWLASNAAIPALLASFPSSTAFEAAWPNAYFFGFSTPTAITPRIRTISSLWRSLFMALPNLDMTDRCC